MNRSTALTILLTCALAAPSFAQPEAPPAPPAPGQPNQPNQPFNPNPPGFQGPGRQGGRGGGGGFQGGGPGGGPGGGFNQGAGFNQPDQPVRRPGPDMQKYEMLRNYIDVVDRFTKLTSDPTAAGVAAVVEATDILRQRGPQTAIDYLTKALGQVQSSAVQRAIRIQLADLYRQSGQADKAIEQLDALMKAADSPEAGDRRSSPR